MKKILLTLFVMSLGSVYAQKNSKEKTHALVLKVLHNKENSSAKTYSMAPCLEDSMVGRIYDTVYNKWQRDYKEIYAYDSNLNNASIYYLNASSPGQSLTPTYSVSMSYNSQGTLTLSLSNVVDLLTNNWRLSGRTTYTYNGSGDKIKQLYEEWDALASTWTTSSQTSFSYTATHSVTVESGEYWINPSWAPSYKVITAYNAASNPTLMLFCGWNTNTNTFDTLQKINYTYTGSQLSSAYSQFWDNTSSSWENEFSYAYTYTNGNLTFEQEQIWVDSAWANSGTYTMTYDAQNNLIQEVDVIIDLETGDVAIQYMSNYYYKCNLVGIREYSKQNGLNLYPNPAHSFLNISTESTYEKCRILNISGQLIFESRDDVKAIPVSQLDKGIYFIQLIDKTNTVVAIEKFVKN